MHLILSTPVFPQALFMKAADLIAGVDRTTVENWMRGGSLIPASLSGGDAFGNSFSGPTFSLFDLIKLSAMADFRSAFGVPPKKASALADEILSRYEREILQVLRANDEGSALPGPVVYKVGRFTLALPLNWWAGRAAGVFDAWSATSAGDVPQLRDALEAWRAEASQ